MALHPSEWLHEAKALAIGRQARVYHGSERRPNLVVYNNHDSWSCYCHSCHEGGHVAKEAVKPITEPVLPLVRGMPTTVDISASNVNLEPIAMYCHKSGVSIQELIDWGFKYDRQYNRLVYYSPNVVMGRSLSPSNIKWFRYVGTGSYIQLGEGSVVFLTEDILSALKIYTLLGQKQPFLESYAVVCCLGTTISLELNVALSTAKLVVLAFDGDEAGWTASTKAMHKLNLLGIPYTVLEVPDGLDPKHLNYAALYERIYNVSKHYVSQGL
jgi:hypothetical protein